LHQGEGVDAARAQVLVSRGEVLSRGEQQHDATKEVCRDLDQKQNDTEKTLVWVNEMRNYNTHASKHLLG